MRNASRKTPKKSDITRTTFEAPRKLVADFRVLAKKRERNLSSELRKLMQDELDRDAA